MRSEGKPGFALDKLLGVAERSLLRAAAKSTLVNFPALAPRMHSSRGGGGVKGPGEVNRQP